MKFVFRRTDGNEFVLDDSDMDKLYDAAWAAVDPEVKGRAVASLRNAISEDDKQLIRDAIAKHGRHEWIHEFGHHGFGTAARNWLRKDGILDAELPPFDAYYGEGTDVRNWDDVYVQALEAAVGCR